MRSLYRHLMLRLRTNIDIKFARPMRGTKASTSVLRLVAVLGFAASLCAQVLLAQDGSVTPVEGDSWLSHLHRSFEETAMGKTWCLGPALALPDEAQNSAPSAPSVDTVVLHGADLYRLNCQGCHGESGLGAPPEIASIINPVRSSSVALVMQRMKSMGADVTRAQASELAGQSKNALLQRLHNGGQDMPSFSYLSDPEVRSLLAYLNLLADVPNAGSQQVAVRESHARVGELIVKSTCHTCHAATGANPDSTELAAGAIPPLATLTARVNRAGLIRKITLGAPVMMGASPDPVRGRMPVFFYLHESEAADVHAYLEAYPPSDSARPQPDVQAASGQIATTNVLPSASLEAHQPTTQDARSAASTLKTWFLGLSIGAVSILCAAVVFTLRELGRLSAEGHVRRSLRSRPVAVVLPFPASSPLSPRNAEPFFAAQSSQQTFMGESQVGL
jgi:mono/diheme cytochrome c family protein